MAAARRLMEVVVKNEGLSNKDLAKFETQIQNLADKWDQVICQKRSDKKREKVKKDM